jgi:glycosyltransferase involved in cell wall biosynthesis
MVVHKNITIMLKSPQTKRPTSATEQSPRILFLDQSGSLGGAELCLLDIAKTYRDHCSIALFSDGPFRHLLETHDINVQIVGKKAIALTKDGTLRQSLSAIGETWPRITAIATAARQYDLIYANTPKALVIGAIASLLAQKPLIYHLHDIISPEHFSPINIQLLIRLANSRALHIIANSEASRTAFIQSGGKSDCISVIYNGFDPNQYAIDPLLRPQIRNLWNWPKDQFIIGHFSRLSPWKGQHILLEALKYCPEEIVAVFVGDALFGEDDYRSMLIEKVEALGLGDRVKFLGFQAQVPDLMSACDLITHTSTAPEPFGRVIVEAMLTGIPVIAAGAGGALEIVEHNRTGWLTPPDDAQALAAAITNCYNHRDQTKTLSQAAQTQAIDRFHQTRIQTQITDLLNRCNVLT